MAGKKDKQQNRPEEIVYEWWRKLKDNKGRRAGLRRAKTLEEVFFAPAYHDLLRKLSVTGWQQKRNVALGAGILAHVENNTGGVPFAAQMASPGKSGSKACVSGLRLRRLLQNKTHGDVFGPLIRIVRLLDKNCNIQNLAQSLYWWNDRTRREWAFAYYARSPAED